MGEFMREAGAASGAGAGCSGGGGGARAELGGGEPGRRISGGARAQSLGGVEPGRRISGTHPLQHAPHRHTHHAPEQEHAHHGMGNAGTAASWLLTRAASLGPQRPPHARVLTPSTSFSTSGVGGSGAAQFWAGEKAAMEAVTLASLLDPHECSDVVRPCVCVSVRQ